MSAALKVRRKRGRQQLREQQIHQAVVRHLRLRGVPGLVFLHPANGGYRTPTEGAIFKALGVRAGASDLLLWHAGQSFALELKPVAGRATEAQLEFLADMKRSGAFTCVAEGLDHALRTLEAWNLLRGKVQTGVALDLHAEDRARCGQK